MRDADLVAVSPSGLFCPVGRFHLDPWGPAEQAVVTHVHSDHARPGSAAYLCAEASVPFLRRRFGAEAVIRGVPYGEPILLGDARVSFHPSGHILGAAQVRIEAGGQVWVVSGDYKRASDPTCPPFEVVPCDVFVTEATFALPIYRWDEPARVAAQIFEWWESNRSAGVASVLFSYAMGKAQRILAELSHLTDRAVRTHGAVQALVELYRGAGVQLPPTDRVLDPEARGQGRGRRLGFAGELILAPPSAMGSPWMRRFGDCETAFASGWMRVRGTRRRMNYDRGFALSDHADWPSLLRTIDETGARRVLVTHGYAEELARYLRERGLAAESLQTAFEGEADA